MKKFKEIIVSKDESVYENIEKLKKDGELEEAWLIISKEAQEKMSKEDGYSVGASRWLSYKFSMALEIANYGKPVPEKITISHCDDPRSIFFLSIKE